MPLKIFFFMTLYLITCLLDATEFVVNKIYFLLSITPDISNQKKLYEPDIILLNLSRGSNFDFPVLKKFNVIICTLSHN